MNRRRIQTSRGTTLLELIVYSVLLLLLLGMVVVFFDYAQKNATITRAATEVQEAAHVTGYRLSLDLMETDPAYVEFYPNASANAVPVGLVFLSARDANDEFKLDNKGEPEWQKYVGYYLDQDPEAPNDATLQALFRAEMVPAGFPTASGALGSTKGVTTATLRASGTDQRLVAHGVRAPTGGDHGGFDAYSMPNGVKSYSTSEGPIYIDLELVNYSSAAQKTAGLDKSNTVQSRLRIRGRK